MFDPGGRFGKWKDNRPGNREPNGWGKRGDLLPNGNIYAIFGSYIIEFGDWGEYKSHWNPNDSVMYVGFTAYVCNRVGERMVRVGEGLKYINMEPGGTFTVYTNVAPWQPNQSGGLIYKWVPNVNQSLFFRTSSKVADSYDDPPTNFTPYNGFISQKQFDEMKAKIKLNNPNAGTGGGLSKILPLGLLALLFNS
jgi:hypothetical protein